MKIDARTKRELFAKKNVVAVGKGFKTVKGERMNWLSIVCSVIEKVPASELPERDLIPESINGIPTDVVQTGIIKALELTNGERKERVRPAPGGVSIGHYKITAGTLGCLVVDKQGKLYILSNNHVLANSNDAEIGDPILQPGSHDSGKFPVDYIADLKKFVPIVFSGDGDGSSCPFARVIAAIINVPARILGRKTHLKAVSSGVNLVDAAIAEPMSYDDVTAEILEVGLMRGIVEGELDMEVVKSGRSSGLTKGTIIQTDVTVNVEYGAGKLATFTDQLMTGSMCEGGDSGSVVLDMNSNLVGLLFAGSDSVMICNRIQNVFDLLGLDLV